MDTSSDPRTAEAWLAARLRRDDFMQPTARHWRRLLAELEPDERVVHLDNLADGSREVFVAVSDTRVLIWSLLSDRMQRLHRPDTEVLEHDTVAGLMRLYDGSQSRPVRLAGDAEQRRALLRALRLPVGASAPQAPIRSLATHRASRRAYEASPAAPPATGDVAEAILSRAGTRKVTFLARGRVGLGPGQGTPAVVALIGRELIFFPDGGEAPPVSGMGLDQLVTEISTDGLRMYFANGGPRWNDVRIRGPRAVLFEVQSHVDAASAEVTATREARERRSAARPLRNDTGVQVSPQLPRTRFLKRPKPVPVSSWQQAEVVACGWLRAMGFSDARVTPPGADLGVDVRGRTVVAQVKWQQSPISRPAVQQLAGVASRERRLGVFFSLSGYTREALSWADQAGMAMFTLNPSGAVGALTQPARKLMRKIH